MRFQYSKLSLRTNFDFKSILEPGPVYLFYSLLESVLIADRDSGEYEGAVVVDLYVDRDWVTDEVLHPVHDLVDQHPQAGQDDQEPKYPVSREVTIIE